MFIIIWVIMNNRLMTIKEVAHQLNISTSTVRRWMDKGTIVAQKVGGQWRFDPNKIQEAYEKGVLSNTSSPLVKDKTHRTWHHITEPGWAKPLIERWRTYLNEYLKTIHPSHVIVNDRRGAKIWSFLMPNGLFS